MAERLKATELEKQQKLAGALFGGTVRSSSFESRSLGPSPIREASSSSSFAARSSLQPLVPPSAPTGQPSRLSQVHSAISADPWDLDFLEATSRGTSRAVSPAPQASRKNSWEIELDPPASNPATSTDSDPQRSSPPLTRPTPSTHPSSISLLGDEFGPLEEAQRGQISLDGDTDDILGLLGAPVEKIDPEQIKRDAARILGSSAGVERQRVVSSTSVRSQSNRSSSPPPHIMGQVVEMGFSIPQSRQALNRTRDATTGDWNVGAAVESLLGGHDLSPAQDTSHHRPSPTPSDIERSPSQPRAPPHRRREDTRSNDTPTQLVNAKEIQDQAAELLAQASAYGTTALGKAASFWKQSKASITKVIEDQTNVPSGPVRMTEAGKVQPKWMKDVQHSMSAGESSPSDGLSPMSPFSDRAGPSSPVKSQMTSKSREPSPQDRRPPEPRQPYVSSARRKVVERAVRKPSLERASSSPDISRRTTPETFSSLGPDRLQPLPSVKPVSKPKTTPAFSFPQLPVVNVNQSQIAMSLTHRNKGNEWFKQGQYSNAEQAYTQALHTLQGAVLDDEPQNAYFGCLPILNNRATARLKNGDGKGAREDVNRVIKILLCEESEMKIPSEHLIKRMESSIRRIPPELEQVLDVNEQLGKALSKRAKLKEDSEKWMEAKSDWESCRSLGGQVLKGAGGMKIVAEGLSRCTKATTSGSGSGGGSRPSAVQPFIQKVAVVTVPSANLAVQKLREANEQAEIESNQKLESKDLVDSKIDNWKSGKENNLRALIASLDQVLWENLNWKKVGMGELLTEGQVKSRYVRAISKVHPDKIPKNATVEEQMIAKSVFAVLNEAWMAMQG
eukprot:GHVU01101677.1.p1 GENE.GHVU01101677.1~~GHVU01101677.1.p1  ORF type:complete len:868 (-),score=67.98 GHVU01101677.1:253-2790(-)